MTPEELQQIVDNNEWEYHLMGGYNRVSVSKKDITIAGYTSKWVRKKIINIHEPLSRSARAVRKWSLHNPDFPAYEVKEGWIAPFLGSTPASDEQIADKLIEIYRNTRNIIADACGSNNFLIYEQKVICIDVDLSLRKGSFDSDDYIQRNNSDVNRLTDYLRKRSFKGMSKSVSVIKTLLYLQKQMLDHEIKNEWITSAMVEKLHPFRLKEEPITADIMELLSGYVDIQRDQNWQQSGYETPKFFKIWLDIQNQRLSHDLVHTKLTDSVWTRELSSLEFLHLVQWLIHQDSSFANKLGQGGYTLLHLAVIYRHTKVVRYLIEAKADLNIVYSGMTALDMALSISREPVIASLLSEAGAGLSAMNFLLLEGESAKTLCQLDRLTKFRQELEGFAHKKSELPETRQKELLSLINLHPHIVTWDLNDKGTTVLHLAFDTDNIFLINELVKLPQWSEFSQINNQKTGWTLWHVISNNEHGNLCPYLNPTNINRLTKDSQSSALHMAVSRSNGELIKILLDLGADPTLEDMKGKNAEDYNLWYRSKTNNPFALFRNDLILLAINSIDLSEPRKTELTALVFQHPHLLSWDLDDKGNSILHHAFSTNNRPLINQLTTLPYWGRLSRMRATVSGRSCFDHIASMGHLEHYDLLKHLVVSPQDFWSSLSWAIYGGHEDFCKRLLADGADPNLYYCNNTPLIDASRKGHASICMLLLKYGANPDVKNSKGQTAEQIWSGTNEANPITQYRTNNAQSMANFGLFARAEVEDAKICSPQALRGQSPI